VLVPLQISKGVGGTALSVGKGVGGSALSLGIGVGRGVVGAASTLTSHSSVQPPIVAAQPALTHQLLAAVRSGNLEQVSVLMAAGVDVDARDMDKRTVFHLAAEQGAQGPQLLQLLWTDDSAAELLDSHGWSPLHAACGGSLMTSDLGAALWLARRPACDVTVRTLEGCMPLHLLCRCRLAPSEDLCTLFALLCTERTVNARSSREGTPLHDACRFSGSVSVLRLLAERGADFEVVDETGLIPLQYLVQNQDFARAAKLVELGAKVGLCSVGVGGSLVCGCGCV
jgi:ankyrin repeat protein